MSESMRHPDGDRLQSLAEGTLPAGDEAVVRSHVADCARCAGELAEWQALFAALEGLPDLEPSAAFADRVMARVDVQPAWATRLVEAGARMLPRTTRAWAFVVVLLAVPALVYGGAVAWLASRPWFSTGWLLAFVQEALVGGYVSGREWIIATIAGSSAAQYVTQLVTSMQPGTLGTAAALFGTATVVSAWVLYRNLIRKPSRESGHGTFAF